MAKFYLCILVTSTTTQQLIKHTLHY